MDAHLWRDRLLSADGGLSGSGLSEEPLAADLPRPPEATTGAVIDPASTKKKRLAKSQRNKISFKREPVGCYFDAVRSHLSHCGAGAEELSRDNAGAVSSGEYEAGLAILRS